MIYKGREAFHYYFITITIVLLELLDIVSSGHKCNPFLLQLKWGRCGWLDSVFWNDKAVFCRRVWSKYFTGINDLDQSIQTVLDGSLFWLLVVDDSCCLDCVLKLWTTLLECLEISDLVELSTSVVKTKCFWTKSHRSCSINHCLQHCRTNWGDYTEPWLNLRNSWT